MRYYADTSWWHWWLGYKCRADTQHQAALSLFDREPQAEVLWTPWQRVEVFNEALGRSTSIKIQNPRIKSPHRLA